MFFVIELFVGQFVSSVNYNIDHFMFYLLECYDGSKIFERIL